MPARKKTWNEKLRTHRDPEVKRLEKSFAGMPEGARMLIASPAVIDAYLQTTTPGQTITPKAMREELADRYRAEYTCPVSTGIFLRTVAEAAWERHLAGEAIASITPFWRVIAPDSELASKLACGADFIVRQRLLENQA